MTEARKIAMVRAMIPDCEDSDEVLSVYLELAGNKVLSRMYPYKTDFEGLEVPEKYVPVQLNVCVYCLNKRGAEGQIQHIENSIHRNYGSADVPNDMLVEVVPYCQAIR